MVRLTLPISASWPACGGVSASPPHSPRLEGHDVSSSGTIRTVFPIGDGVTIEDGVDRDVRRLSRQAGRALTSDEEASLRQQLRTAFAQGSAMAWICTSACMGGVLGINAEGRATPPAERGLGAGSLLR